MLNIVSSLEKETKQLGSRLASLLSGGDIVCLTGDLGAGKTVFVKGLAEGLNLSSKDVISPTFVLINEYHPRKKSSLGLNLYHFDLYRLNKAQDIVSLGIEEYFCAPEGICAVEWFERLNDLQPKEFLRVELSIKSELVRKVKLTAHGKRYKEILRKLV